MFKFNFSFLYLVDNLIIKTILYIMFYWYDVHLQFYMLLLYILFFVVEAKLFMARIFCISYFDIAFCIPFIKTSSISKVSVNFRMDLLNI